MIWVGWRQQRTESLIAIGLLAALAAVLVPTGLHIASVYDQSHISGCLASPGSDACGLRASSFVQRFDSLSGITAWITLVPGIIGLLLAAPFVTALEQRTCRLDWTQGITRQRWLAGKLGLAAGSAVAGAVILTLLLTWWRAPLVHVQGRMGNSVYDSEGVVPVAYALFALGLAAALGAAWRRTTPALLVAFGGYFASRIFVDTWLRQHLASPVAATWSAGNHGPDLDRSWVLHQYALNGHGQPLPDVSCPHNMGGTCQHVVPGGGLHAIYFPPSSFWTLQYREALLFLALAAVGFAVAVRLTLRRPA